jgi:hypothetical protein
MSLVLSIERYHIDSINMISDNITRVRRVMANPKLVHNRVKYINNSMNSSLFQYISDGGVSIMDQNWDNLIILDACRYDIFKKICDIEGDLRCVRSMGSNSWEWVRKNLAGKQFYDTVYESAGERGVRYMSAGKRVCTARKSVSDS